MKEWEEETEEKGKGEVVEAGCERGEVNEERDKVKGGRKKMQRTGERGGLKL